MSMNWFEKWFDSPLYEQLYSNRDEVEARKLTEFLLRVLELNRCSRILDLGCGRGRHAMILNQKGYRVKGIDLSKQAIRAARNKAENLGLKEISFEVRDMRDPLPEKFDAIVNLFTTFGYFHTDKENARVFDSVVHMLKPNGIFVLDYLNASKVRSSYRAKDTGELQDFQYSISRYIQDDAIIKDIDFKGGRVGKVQSYSERVKLYDLSWFKRNMGQRGLEIDHVFGDYEGNDFDAGTSPRLLIISRLRQR